MWKWMLLQIILLQSKYGGILDEDLGLRWVCLGFDEIFVFHGHHIGVISQLKLKFVFVFVDVHCMTHRTNLVIVVFFILPFKFHIELML
jgi:hypothetical protein